MRFWIRTRLRHAHFQALMLLVLTTASLGSPPALRAQSSRQPLPTGGRSSSQRLGRLVTQEDIDLHRDQPRASQHLHQESRQTFQRSGFQQIVDESTGLPVQTLPTTGIPGLSDTSTITPSMEAMSTGSGMPSMLSLSAGTEKPADFTILAGEPYSIRVPETIGAYKTYTQGRRDFLTVTPMAGATELGVQMLDLVGSKPGVTDLILIGENQKTAQLRIAVKPSVASLQAELAKNFPDCNVELSMPGDNLIMVTGTVESAAQVEPIITLLRSLVGTSGQVISGLRISGVMQVQLDVVVAYINRTKARSLGFNFTEVSGDFYLGQQVGNIATPPAGIAPAADVFNPLKPGGVPSAASVFFGVADQKGGFFGYVDALQRNACFKVMANPSLVTLSGRPATFRVGGEQPYPITSSLGGGSGVQFKPFGTSLVFTPVVLGQGKIRLELRPEVSRLDGSNPFQVNGEAVPSVINQEVHAVVEMESGQTLILGGLLETQMLSRVNKIPYLGDLPVAGALFRRVEQQEEERELLVMATPRLVAPIEPEQGPIALPGDESRVPTDHELYCKGLPEVQQDCNPQRGARTQLYHEESHGNPYPLKSPMTKPMVPMAPGSVEPGLMSPGIVTPMSYQVAPKPSKRWGFPKRPATPNAKQ